MQQQSVEFTSNWNIHAATIMVLNKKIIHFALNNKCCSVLKTNMFSLCSNPLNYRNV